MTYITGRVTGTKKRGQGDTHTKKQKISGKYMDSKAYYLRDERHIVDRGMFGRGVSGRVAGA